jgi:hypothetical protein
MPKEDWQKNTVESLFRGWGAWPWDSKVDPRGASGPRPGRGAPFSILDVACGLSLKGKFIRTNTLVGLDLHAPYLKAVEGAEPGHDWIPVVADVNEIQRLFLPNSFDLVLALDIIEHLEKPDALRLLTDLERVAKVAVILETPRGFLPQDKDILGFSQHHLQTHRCGFEKEELEELGYQTFVRDYELAPVKRHSTEPIQTQCQLLNAIKRVDQ